ncbi:MAG: S9 family peptidase [Gammaproteobacteria bacterium]
MQTIARVCCLLFLSCGLALPALGAESTPSPGYTIAQIFAEPGLTGYQPEQVEWSHDGRHLTYLLRHVGNPVADLYIVDTETGKTSLLLTGKQLASAAEPPSAIKNQIEQERITRYHVDSYHWSPKGDALFYLSNDQLYLYNLSSRATTQITHESGVKRDPQLSPDEQWVSYVSNGDVHYVSVHGGAVHTVVPHEDGVLNGELNWVYTEELDLRSVYTWSPDSRYVAFLQSDERPVRSFPLINYVEQQPSVYEQKYPTAGAPNPIVRLGVHDVQTGKTAWMPMAGTPDTYLVRFGWLTKGNQVYGEVLNRDQTRLQLLSADPVSARARVLVTQTDPDWIEVRDAPHFLKSGGFIWGSQQDGWHHLYLYSDDGRTARKLTSGDYNVLELAGVDEQRGELYFTQYTHGPLNTELYRVSLRGGEPRAVTTISGTHDINMGPQARYYLDTYSNVLIPPSVILANVENNRRVVIQAAAQLPYHFAKPRFFTMLAADGRTPIYARLTLPPEFDPGKKYPVIMYQYGGPDVPPIVRDAWGGTNFLFDQLLANQGFILFATDNRAATYFSHRDQALVKDHLGELALVDQLAAVNWLKSRPWVDASRIGIWGWSYGGYMTTYALTHAPNVWRAGIAVAPVTQWQDYDSIYTERYMGTPQENPAGYAESSTVAAAGNLANPLLLVAGTGDDNVHWQNTMQFIQALIDTGKPYQLLIYPNKTHGISGPAARTHLFTAMQQFWEEQLKE